MGIALIALMAVAFYAGKESIPPKVPIVQVVNSLATTTNPTDVGTTSTNTNSVRRLPTSTTVESTTSVTSSPVSNKTYTPVLTRISISSSDSTTILKCTGLQLYAKGFDQKGATMLISPFWSSSDDNVATVSTKGSVVSKNVGKAIMTARSGNISGSIQITVIVSAGRGNGSPCPAPRR
jgi:hypothetical protein